MSSASQPNKKKSIKTNYVDNEWIELMLIAKKIGITPNEIRMFLKHKKITG